MEASSAELPREGNGIEQAVGPDVGDGTRDLRDSTDELPDNTIVSLLSVSYSFRTITLKLLSIAFGIDQTADGVCVHLFELNRRPYVSDYSL